MGSNLLNIGKSGLLAAQVGMATTGNNITNANVPGYSRERIVQSASKAQDVGYGFVGSGTEVNSVVRYYSDFLTQQLRSAQSSKSALDTYNAQISQVDNLLADTSSGLAPALQDFFKGVQDVASNPASAASRQALLSTADSLAGRFQGLNGRLVEIRDGVNSQITSNVTVINSFATQIADLNDQIGKFGNSETSPPNDLLDKRDQIISEMNKQVKTTVTDGGNGSVTVSVGSGQPLVVGNHAFQLAVTNSPTDLTRVQVGYVTGTKVTVLADSALSGGELGGLLEFRSTTLDKAQNDLGRIAVGLAQTFNAQHALGQDQNGALGGTFFTEAPAVVGANVHNNVTSTAVVTAKVSDASKLTGGDYRVDYDGSNYTVTPLKGGPQTLISPYPQVGPQTIDGVDFTITGASAQGDSFVVQPTINGASGFTVAISDLSKIAAAAPITTTNPTTNTGHAQIGAGSVGSDYLVPANQLAAPFTLTYTGVPGSPGLPGTLSGFPAGQSVTVTVKGQPPVVYAPGVPVKYVDGATLSIGGANNNAISVDFTGLPLNGDTFTVGPNTAGVGDNRNARLLGALQTTNIFNGKSTTYQGAYAEAVSVVGNKAREVQVNSLSGDALLAQATQAQQSVSGVNLDEEATNLLRYQQAYQAAGKVMQIASTMFDVLLSIGH